MFEQPTEIKKIIQHVLEGVLEGAIAVSDLHHELAAQNHRSLQSTANCMYLCIDSATFGGLHSPGWCNTKCVYVDEVHREKAGLIFLGEAK